MRFKPVMRNSYRNASFAFVRERIEMETDGADKP
jgi:hypothetical protein